MSTPPVVAVIHANPATMQPVRSAFADRFPGADLWHLLDDRLVTDAERAGGLTEPLQRRMSTLIQYAVEAGADAVQLACSMYGPAATQSNQPVPVLASDQAMFDEVVRLRPGKVAILASLEPAAQDSTERLLDALSAAAQQPEVQWVVVPAAKTASASGDLDELGRALSQAAAGLGDVDVIVLAQYSLSPVIDQVQQVVDVPVLSGPHLAATSLAVLIEGRTR